MPQRIQLRRTPGWRKPEGAVVVARPTKWGNPINWQDYRRPRYNEDGEAWVPSASACRSWAVTDFQYGVLLDPSAYGYPSQDDIRRELAGHDLACWCPLPEAGQPDHCHAAVLLRLANQDTP